jgi:HSP20 family protein
MKSMMACESDPLELMEHIFSGEPLTGGEMRMPAVDLREEDKRYLIEAELPGISERELKLELRDGVLELTAGKKEESGEKEGRRWIRRERRETSFRRSFALPEDADGERIEAQFKNGLLTVELPKKAATEPKLVPIKAA